MPTIKVDFGKMSQLESQLSRVPGVIGSAASSVSSVRSGLDWDVACEASIDRKLRDIANALNDSKSRMQKTARFVGNAVQQYQKAENGVEDFLNSNRQKTASSGGMVKSRSSSAIFTSLLTSYKNLKTNGFAKGIKRSDAEIYEDIKKAIGKMYGYPASQSAWTSVMKSKVEQFISSGTVTEISEGMYCISNGDMDVYLNAGGELLRTAVYKETATNLEITEKIYHSDGSFEKHTSRGGLSNTKISADEELSVKLSQIEVYDENNTSSMRRYERFVEDTDSTSKILVELLKFQNGSSWNAGFFKVDPESDSLINFSPEFGGGIDFHADIVDLQITEGQNFGNAMGTEVTANIQVGSFDAEVMPVKISTEDESIKIKSALDLKADIARIPLETEIKTIEGSGFLEGINIKFAPEVSYGVGATLSSELSLQGVWEGRISAAWGQGAGASITIDASEYIDNTVENISNTFKKLYDFGSKLNSLKQNSQQTPFVDYKVLAM